MPVAKQSMVKASSFPVPMPHMPSPIGCLLALMRNAPTAHQPSMNCITPPAAIPI